MNLRFISREPGRMEVVTPGGLEKGILKLYDFGWVFEPEKFMFTRTELQEIIVKVKELNDE